MKIITTLISLFLAFNVFGQISTNGVFVKNGITTEVEKKVYEISPTNEPAMLYFSNGLVARVNTNSEFIVNSFFQDVLNIVPYPQIAKFDNSILNVSLMKGSALFKYNEFSTTNCSCVVSTPLIDVELQTGTFYIDASDTKVIVAVLKGNLKSHNGKKETIISEGQAIIAEPNDVGILEDKITVKPGKVNVDAKQRLISDVENYLDTYEDSLFFIRINGKTIAVDK